MASGKRVSLSGWLCLALAVILLAACAPAIPGSTAAPGRIATPPAGTQPVDPLFREFHPALGGDAVLGYAISPLFDKSDAQCQYTQNALMCYNPALAENARYYLYPIGRELSVRDDPLPVTEPGRERVINGYIIDEQFLTRYDALFGSKFVGLPLSQIHHNELMRRYEQFFENLGFYRLDGAPRGQVQMIQYGAIHCGGLCSFEPSPESAIPGGMKPVAEVFRNRISRINGGTQAFGMPLTAPYQTADGSIEQVYEKAVFTAPAGNMAEFQLKPLPLILGIAFGLPVPRNNDPRLVFYPQHDGLGYNVPAIFDYFIARHGGMEISGQPISEVTAVPGQNLARQCFENYCLDYDPGASEDQQVRIFSAGLTYIQYAGLGEALVQQFTYSNDSVLLNVGEKRGAVAVDEPQELYMVVLQRRDNRPIPNIAAEGRLILPDGSQAPFHVDPTDANGKSVVRISPLAGVSNGTVIQYQICLSVPSEQPICASETYLVWNGQ